jgi:hypothetical protein
MVFDEPVEPDQALKNIKKQGTKILKDISNAYDQGLLDHPQTAYMFCALLACICEGKVEGTFDEDKNKVEWTLTKKYHAILLELEKDIFNEESQKLDNVIKGPWK